MSRLTKEISKQELLRFCQEIGLDTVGVIPARRWEELVPFLAQRKAHGVENEFEVAEIEKRVNPATYLPGVQSVISIAFPYWDGKLPTVNGFSIYTQRRDYHQVVGSYLEKIVTYLVERGGQAIGLVDSHGLPERYLAYLSGIGTIGRNNMLFTSKYGSYVFLGEVLTDIPIVGAAEAAGRGIVDLAHYTACGTCTRCLEACPTKAIRRERSNCNICLSYLTQKKELSLQEMQLLQGDVFGCDRCQLACPRNQLTKPSNIEAFATMPEMLAERAVYAQMDNRFFKEVIKTTSCGWRGKNVIKRNALLGHWQQSGDLLVDGGDSLYLQTYVERLKALNQLKKEKNE